VSINLDDSQRAAVDASLAEGDHIITGGAGTGKTTIIKAIYESLNKQAVMMAPTGKAAARLREATGYEARTIHSELTYDGTIFRRMAPFTSPVIIDEGSMIEAPLMAKLLEFRPPKLILVGDSAQLPPVGHGCPFHDLIDLMPERVSRLTTCHRAQGAVHLAASAIRKGEAPAERMESGGESFKIIDSGGTQTTATLLRGWLEKGLVDPERDIIIAPQYGSAEAADDGGIHALNRLAKSILNPSGDAEGFTIGDRVICVKNFSDADLWNGDLGTVVDISTQGLPEVSLDREASAPEDIEDGKTRFITKEQVKFLQLAYVLSVHKSQGSQFRRVIFVVHRAHSTMLTRALIYTAVTRARQGCAVIGEPAAFYKGLNNVERRRTVLQHLAGVAA